VEGVHEEEFRIKTGTSFSDVTEKEKLAALIKDGLLAYEKPFWRPTKKGLLMADALAREIVIF
jgi:coproporphyrinogen III oxidase-like Fe-S oxidoreductase